MTNFDAFWQAYPGKKVAKPKCKDKYDKLSDDEHKEVMLAIQAQVRYRACLEKTGTWIENWVNSQTFINQSRWYDEIPSHSALKEKSEAKKCHCGEEYPCPTHFYATLCDDWRWSLINQEWRRLGKPKTQQECIEALRKEGKLNLLLILKRPPGKRGGNPTKLGDT